MRIRHGRILQSHTRSRLEEYMAYFQCLRREIDEFLETGASLYPSSSPTPLIYSRTGSVKRKAWSLICMTFRMYFNIRGDVKEVEAWVVPTKFKPLNLLRGDVFHNLSFLSRNIFCLEPLMIWKNSLSDSELISLLK